MRTGFGFVAGIIARCRGGICLCRLAGTLAFPLGFWLFIQSPLRVLFPLRPYCGFCFWLSATHLGHSRRDHAGEHKCA